MTIKKRFILYFSVIFLVVSLLSIYLIWISYEVEKYLSDVLPLSIIEVQEASKLDIIAQMIRYDDEVLTQSARNYAFTGDSKWLARYNEFVSKLDLRIKEAIALGDAEDKEIFKSINDANLVLVDLETKAFDLANGGDLILAQQILDSEEYFKQKASYKAGIDKYLARRGGNFDSATAVTIQAIERSELGLHDLVHDQIFIAVCFVVASFFILLFLIFLILKTFIVPLNMFKKVAKEITSGKLEAKVVINKQDEIGDFAVDFNKMTDKLKDSIQNTERKIEKRTADLEKTNKFMVGRELKMVELKREIQKLKSMLDKK